MTSVYLFTVFVARPPWNTTYVLVPQNSSVIIECTTNSPNPYFSIDIGNYLQNQQFISSRSQQLQNLLNHGLYSMDNMSNNSTVTLLINQTEKNNGTTVHCFGGDGAQVDEITLILYGIC